MAYTAVLEGDAGQLVATLWENSQDVATDVERGSEEVHVMVDGNRADLHGVSPQEVAQVIEAVRCFRPNGHGMSTEP